MRRRPTNDWKRRPSVGRRVATAGLLVALGISLLLSVPALRPVLHAITEISPWWIAAAVALELASCVSFVIIFRLFFDRVAARDTYALAWTSMASGALLPGGGVGGYAIGGWLMHLTGAPTRWIVRRSSGLFFLTSAVNSAAVIGAGLLLLAGAADPHDFARAGLPVLLAGAATLVVLALPWIAHHRRRTAPVWLDSVVVGIRDAEQTAAHRSWRLLGALGYPGFDMAVLWVAFSALGHAPPIPGLVLGYSIGYLVNTLPVPGGIGVLDAGLSGALLLYGASPAHVVAAVLVYHAVSFWIPSAGGLIAYARLRPRLTDPSSDDPPSSSPSSSLTHISNRLHQEVSHERTPADPQTNRPRMDRLLDRRPGGRSLPWSWFEVACAALPRRRDEAPAGPGGREEGRFSANGGQVLAGLRRVAVRLGAGSGFAGSAPSHRLGVPRRLAVALLALSCVLPLLAPNQSSASSLVVRREANAGSLQPSHARHDQVPPHLTAAAPSRPDVPSSEGAFLPFLLVLALNSVVMVIRLVSSPPSWMKG
jgi:uncharacterized membrane protein YbhN (UPF0104 family)